MPLVLGSYVVGPCVKSSSKTKSSSNWVSHRDESNDLLQYAKWTEKVCMYINMREE